jgi:hypothetical protein
MTSHRQIKANRRNARLSTGPRTREGRNRSAQNARRHGLTAGSRKTTEFSPAIEQLARQIAGSRATLAVRDLARRVAIHQLDLQRVRNARYSLLKRLISEARTDATVAANEEKFALIDSPEFLLWAHFDRYEREAIARRDRVIYSLDAARASK